MSYQQLILGFTRTGYTWLRKHRDRTEDAHMAILPSMYVWSRLAAGRRGLGGNHSA